MQSYRGKWTHALIGLAILAIISLVSFAVAAEKPNPAEGNASTKAGQDKLAVINETVITRAEFEREFDGVKQQFQAMGQPMEGERLADIQKDILENMISTELLYQAAKKQGTTIDPSEVDQKFLSVKQRFPKPEDFADVLEKMKMAEAELKDRLTRGMIIQKFIDQEILQKIVISDEAAKSYYDANRSSFAQPEQARASHILIKVDKNADESQRGLARKKLEEIQQKLKDGADFAELAKEFSQCPSSSRGGDLGYFRRGQMVLPFEQAAFSLNVGEVSQIVETQFGFHLIKLADKKAEEVKTFDEVKEWLAQRMKQEKFQDQLTQYVAKLRAEAKVESYLPSVEEPAAPDTAPQPQDKK